MNVIEVMFGGLAQVLPFILYEVWQSEHSTVKVCSSFTGASGPFPSFEQLVVSDAVLDEESSTATEAVWLFFPDCAATSLRYDSIFVNGVQMFKASDSTYLV